jgi:protein TonB
VHPATADAAASETAGVVLSSKGAEKRLLSSVPPQYQPSMAKTATRSEGAVVLIVSVDTDGKVANARVTEGQSDFANAAVAAVRHWRYRPYMRDGIAVPFETVVQISPPQP